MTREQAATLAKMLAESWEPIGEPVPLLDEREDAEVRAALGLMSPAQELVLAEALEIATTAAQRFVIVYLASNGTSPARWVVKAASAESPPVDAPAVERALVHLVGAGHVEEHLPGYFGLTARAGCCDGAGHE